MHIPRRQADPGAAEPRPRIPRLPSTRALVIAFAVAEAAIIGLALWSGKIH